MCAPSVIEAALSGMSRRDALHFAAGMVAGAIGCVSCMATGTNCSAHDAPSDPPPGGPGAKRMIAADKILDLTHTLSPTFPIWPGNEPIKITNKSTFAKSGFYSNRWDIGEHHGTHLDAPAHCSANGSTAEKIEPSSFIAPAVVIDIRERVKKDSDATVTADELRAWEKAHGRLPKGCAVCLNSGWDAKAGDAKAFLGTDAANKLHFPGFSKGATEFLLNERDVAGLLVDTLSIDTGSATDFPVHKLWLGAGKWAVECVANLGKVPPSGATVFIGAPKVAGASGGPTRVLAMWG
ncbi:MAG: cyclase family protein [Planctomycetia bacterium]|nr:cyclase family protein [Planctomycetia bacterium]